jgi:flavin reductase (DIM6/NTAB) family NADH-FMN oxidoreductase RutF
MTWNKIAPKELLENPFRLIADDWTLITAGTPTKWNTMTAAWGGLGVLWSRPVTFIFVRPTRYTFEFLEKASWHTLSFFDEQYRSALNHCGKVSGRDHDKAAETGLEPVTLEHQTVAFSQARLVLVSRKLHAQDLDPAGFIDPSLQRHYEAKDYHRLYVGEIEEVLIRP